MKIKIQSVESVSPDEVIISVNPNEFRMLFGLLNPISSPQPLVSFFDHRQEEALRICRSFVSSFISIVSYKVPITSRVRPKDLYSSYIAYCDIFAYSDRVKPSEFHAILSSLGGTKSKASTNYYLNLTFNSLEFQKIL